MNYTTTDDAFLAGGGEMGALVRAIDWSERPLGPPAAWPQSLRTAVSLCLMSRFPMAVCWGPSYAIVYNDAYRPILGNKHPWAMGRPCFEVWRELAHIVQPMFDGVIETGEATWSDDLMLPMLRHGYLEEAYFTVSYSAIPGESAAPEGILVTVTETTDRYLAERRLRLVRELGDASGAARSVDQVADLVGTILARHVADVPFSLLYEIDADAGEARLSAATGIERGGAAAPGCIPLAGAAAEAAWPVQRAIDGAEPVVLDNLARFGALPGGIWPEAAKEAVLLPIPRPGRASANAVLVAGVNPRRALDAPHLDFFQLVARQIANATANAIAHEESRRRAEALAEIDRAKTAFFSNVSHEFRTPLTLMLGPLQDVLATDAITDGDRERLEVARRNSLRLLKLVNSLLDFSRIEAGRIRASYEPTDLAAFTADLASVFRSTIERAGLRFRVECEPTAAPVCVDREMWEKIVLNLVSNAFKFTFDGEITVSLRQVDDYVELAVGDTGTGIPAGDVPHLFERFHRVRNARSRSFEGSGIGLALVRELVRLHGGEVTVESELDRGSRFLVRIPAGSDHLPAERLSAASAAAPAMAPQAEAWVGEMERWVPAGAAVATGTEREGRVLVADDNADMRDYVRRLLAGRYDVETVGDGIQALQAIRERPPDVVLSDVMMPQLDGIGLLAALRSDPATSDIPVVLVSARAGEEARVDGLRAGADDYLVKPFSANELVARIASTVQLARLRREGEARLAAANRELRRHVLEQEALLDVLPVGIGIATDPECRDIRINRAFAATLGLSAAANASKTAPPDERPTTFRVLTPDGDEVPDDQLPMQVAAREGRTIADVEVDVVHSDGRVVRLLEYTVPLVDEHGTPRGAVGAFVDITERKRTEQALEQEVAVRTALAQAGASLAGELQTDRLVQAITDIATRLTTAEFGAFFYNVTDENGDAYQLYSLSGAPKEAFARMPHPRATAVFGPTFRGEAIIRLDDVTKDARYGHNPPFHGMPDGHLPVRSYLAVPVIARGGPVLGGLFFAHSRPGVFTAQHEQLASGVASWAAIALDNARLYRDVEQTNRLKDEFLATLSHELRTPLNAVLGWAQMLRKGTMDPGMRERALDSLERNARAQAQLVEDLLDVSRVISGKLHLRADEVDLGVVVGHAVETVRAGVAAKGLLLQAQHAADGERILVTGDADRLQQVVWNLVSNAIKFTPAGGRIDVELRRADGKAEISVRDSGQGIPASFLPHLFERFRQMDASIARRHGGLGLGLSIVRHLTEAHGGTVEAESAGEGLGATFRVRLPLRAAVTREAPAAVLDVSGLSHPLAEVRALVVDDDPDARELIRFILESRGARVITAASAGEALHLLDQHAFDVLIGDIGMPEHDGYSLIRMLRDMPDPGRKALPAIAVTAYANLRERDAALDAGYDWHLGKPVDPEQLVATVSAAARRV